MNGVQIFGRCRNNRRFAVTGPVADRGPTGYQGRHAGAVRRSYNMKEEPSDIGDMQ